jgi:exosome complex RNA-binding protein Csl4
MKCHAKAGGYAVTFCQAMSSTVNFRTSKNQTGLFVSKITNIVTGEDCGDLVFLATKERKNGIVFNVCPFCGGSLIDQEKAKGE